MQSSKFRATKYWKKLADGRVQCDLCPRECKLRDGQQGLCFVRANVDGAIVLTTDGRSSGFCVDPIEKKPLNHFLPGTPILSFGTAGCNLSCKFCQNWDISKSREMDTLANSASAEAIAEAAETHQCRSVAYTYNDPVIFHEYAIDVAQACREKCIKSVSVSAGYVNSEPREEFYQWMDAANIDLKSFSEKFYHKVTGGHLQPVLETLEYLKHETQCWVELTTLLIPGLNDSEAELQKMTQWVAEHLGPDVPMHFTAFHPDWKMRDVPATPASTLRFAREIAVRNGIQYAYIGNVLSTAESSTYCPTCHEMVIERTGYELGKWDISPKGQCRHCGAEIAGVFEAQPGHWGARRLPIRIN